MYEDADNVELAFDYLGGIPLDDHEAFALARRLKEAGRFSYARRVLDRLRKHTIRKRVSDPDFLHELREAHSLCTYKDKDIPAARRYEEALRLLESDGVVLEKSTRLETLGQAGSIFRRKWEQELEVADLQRACHYYRLAYDLALKDPVENRMHLAWAGINFAYTLDLLARRFAEESQEDQFAVFPYRRLQKRAQEVRQVLITELGEVTTRAQEEYQRGDSEIDVRDLWWLLSVIGEAHYGRGEWDEAQIWFTHASELKEGVQEWHLETTSRRIAALALMQEKKIGTAGEFSRSRPGQVLRAYLGEERSEGVQSTFRGKVGLALSGGGFRASFFHLGVLARLAELDLLRHVEVISCVSGGSILGACYYLKLRRLLKTTAEADLEPEDYLRLVDELATEFLAGVQENLRISLVTDLRSNWRMVFDSDYTRTERAAELFESLLFSRVDPDSASDAPPPSRWRMQNLRIEPPDKEGFHPRYNNWYRKYKVPMLILNASTLNTGHNWQFTGTWMGEPPGRINGEIDANERLRRLYLNGAPGDYGDLNLGRAVAASACVPGLFEPISFPDLYDDRVVRLVDGGVFDNQGVSALQEEGCNVLLISDASGQMNNEEIPAAGMLDVPLRTNAILMERVRQAQFMELAARRRSGVLRSLMFVHLTKDLDVLPVNWKGCREPADTAREARLLTDVEYLTPYRVHRDLERKLARMRTDLDSFTEVEAYSLMASGYQMTREYAPDLSVGPDATEEDSVAEESRPVRDPNAPYHRQWQFLRVSAALKQPVPDPDLARLLEVGRFSTLRYFRLKGSQLRWVLKWTSILLGALLLGVGGLFAWRLLPGSVAWGALVGVACLLLLVSGLLMAVRPVRDRLPGLAVDLALATVGYLAARVHLRFIEPGYFRWGSLERFEARWRSTAGAEPGDP